MFCFWDRFNMIPATLFQTQWCKHHYFFWHILFISHSPPPNFGILFHFDYCISVPRLFGAVFGILWSFMTVLGFQIPHLLLPNKRFSQQFSIQKFAHERKIRQYLSITRNSLKSDTRLPKNLCYLLHLKVLKNDE